MRKSFPLRSKIFTFITFIQHSIGNLSHSNQKQKRNQRVSNCKGGSKTIIFRCIIKNPKYSTRKPLILRNEFIKVPRYKINIKKLFAYLYINNKLSEREIKKTILFIITSKRIKYLGINLTKVVNDYTQKTMILKKQSEDTSGRIYRVH